MPGADDVDDGIEWEYDEEDDDEVGLEENLADINGAEVGEDEATDNGGQLELTFGQALEQLRKDVQEEDTVREDDPQTAATIEAIRNKNKLTRELFEARKRAREEKRARKRLKLKNLEATLLGRVAICLNLNLQTNALSAKVKALMPENIQRDLSSKSLAGMQSYLSWVRRTFRRSPPSTFGYRYLFESVLRTKEGSECAIVQLLVAGARAFHIPSRLIVRFTQAESFEDDDVWAEFLLPFNEEGKAWHRAFATATRVFEADEQERRLEKKRTIDPSTSSAVASRPGQSNGALSAIPRRIDIKPHVVFVMAFGKHNQMTLVSQRYCSTRSVLDVARNPLLRFISTIVRDWNDRSADRDEDDESLLIGEQMFLEKHFLKETTVPTTLHELKTSTDFVLERNLSQTQFVLPGAKPINYFKGEAVFRREHVGRLLNEFGWKKLGRIVRDDVKDCPRKVLPRRVKIEMTSSSKEEPPSAQSSRKKKRRTLEQDDEQTEDDVEDFIDPRRKLYDESQTMPIDPGEVDAEIGSVPTNEYGNVELWCEAYLPRGACHLVVDNADMACKQLKIPFASAMIGYDFSDQRRPKPKFSGVVIAKQNGDKVRQRANEITEREAVEREEQGKRDRARLWKDLLEAHWIVANSTLNASSSTAPTQKQKVAPASVTPVVDKDKEVTEDRRSMLQAEILARMNAPRAAATLTMCDHTFRNGICQKCALPESDIEYF